MTDDDDVKHNDLEMFHARHSAPLDRERCVADTVCQVLRRSFQCSFKGKYPIQTSEGVLYVCGVHKHKFKVMSDD